MHVLCPEAGREESTWLSDCLSLGGIWVSSARRCGWSATCSPSTRWEAHAHLVVLECLFLWNALEYQSLSHALVASEAFLFQSKYIHALSFASICTDQVRMTFSCHSSSASDFSSCVTCECVTLRHSVLRYTQPSSSKLCGLSTLSSRFHGLLLIREGDTHSPPCLATF